MSATKTAKRAPNAYNLFLKDETNRNQYSDCDSKEIMTKLAGDWKALTDEEKQVWKDKAAEAKLEFDKIKASSSDSDGDTTTTSSKKVKKPRQKRAPNAYNLFLKDEENRNRYPDASSKEIMGKLADDWKQLSDEDKEKWNELAAKAKAEFQEKNGKPTKKRQSRSPKRAPNAYNLFLKDEENRNRYPDATSKEIMGKLAEDWGNLTSDEKQVWTDKANEAKLEFEEKHGKPQRRSKSSKSPKRPPTAYNLFNKDSENREKYPDLTATAMMKQLAEDWNNLSPEEKQVWNDMAKRAKDDFKAGHDKKDSNQDADNKPTTTPYTQFLNNESIKAIYRQQHEGKPEHEITRIMGMDWIDMNDEQKSNILLENC